MLRQASLINGSRSSLNQGLSGRSGLMAGLFTKRFFGGATGFDADLAAEMSRFKVSPAAGWWMRNYLVLPSQVKATGPRGYHTKGDVLAFIEANKLELRPADAFVPPTETPAAKP